MSCSTHLVHDRTLSSEVRGLVVKNGRIDHQTSGHDDMVISWMMTHWFLTHTTNLSYYGIDTTKALSKVHHEGRVLTPQEEFELEEQERIKEQIEDIYEELTKATDEYVISQYERKLMALNGRVKDGNVDVGSIDSLINSAAQARQKAARDRSLQQRREQRGQQWRQRRSFVH